MAYSSNQTQLELWGPSFLGLERIDGSPCHSLKYWHAVHRSVFESGRKLGSRFLLLNYDRLCADPEGSLGTLFEFLGAEPTRATRDRLLASICPPPSLGRFRRHSPSDFDPEDVAFARNLGFDTNYRIWSSDTRSATAARTIGSSNAHHERLGPIGRGDERPLPAVVLGMHRSGTSALTSLLDRLGFYAGPDGSLVAADDYNAKGYWEHRELHALDEELLATLGGSWTDVLEIDSRRLSDSAHASLLPRARALVDQLDSYGPWVIKDPRLCLLLPFWRELLERPLCILIHRDPLSVARSLARRDGLPIPVGIALWEHYNRAALAVSRGLPRVLVGYRGLVDDPAATARRLIGALAASGVQGLERLRELSPADARSLIDSSLEHHAVAPDEDLGYLNTPQRELLHALESGAALLHPVPPLSAGAREILHVHTRQAREAAAQRQAVVNVQAALAHSVVERQQALTAALQEIRAATAAAAARETELAERIEAHRLARDSAVAVLEHRLTGSERERDDLLAELHRMQGALAALEHRQANTERERDDMTTELHRKQRAVVERDALLAAVFASPSWRLGFGLKRLLGALRGRRSPTALERWQSLRDG